MLAGVGMLDAHLRLGVGVGFVRPAVEHGLAQWAQFHDHALLGGVGVGAVGDGLVEGVEEVVQANRQCGPVRQARFQRPVRVGRRGSRERFIVHARPWWARTDKSTSANATAPSTPARHFRSHPGHYAATTRFYPFTTRSLKLSLNAT